MVEIVDIDARDIKAYIERSGFKQKAVAEKSGLNEFKLCMSLQGKRKLEAREYASICSALGVPMTMFVTGLPDATVSGEGGGIDGN